MHGASGVCVANWKHDMDGMDGCGGDIDGADSVQGDHFEYYKDKRDGLKNMNCTKGTEQKLLWYSIVSNYNSTACRT